MAPDPFLTNTFPITERNDNCIMIKGSSNLSVGLRTIDQLSELPASTGPSSVTSADITLNSQGNKVRRVRKVRKVRRSDDDSVISRASSRASQKDMLENEIRRVQAQLEKKQLEAEIKKMEEAIQLQAKKAQEKKAQEEKDFAVQGMQSASELVKSEVCTSAWAYSEDADENELKFREETEEIDFSQMPSAQKATSVPIKPSLNPEEDVIRLPITPRKPPKEAVEEVIRLPITPRKPPKEAVEEVIRLPITPRKPPKKAQDDVIRLPITPRKVPAAKQKAPKTPVGGRSGFLASIKLAAAERSERSERTSLNESCSTLATSQSVKDSERLRLEEEIRLAEHRIQAKKQVAPIDKPPLESNNILPVPPSLGDNPGSLQDALCGAPEQAPRARDKDETLQTAVPKPPSNDDDRVRLAEEIRQMQEKIELKNKSPSVVPLKQEGQLERKQLEEEIRRMQEAIGKTKQKTPERTNLPTAISNTASKGQPQVSDAASVQTNATQKELERQRLEEEIRQMERSIEQVKSKAKSKTPEKPAVNTTAPDVNARPNLFAAITKAATERESRIEENNGELTMKEVKPEVETKPSTPQLSFALAEMVTKKARDREKRLEEGGEKKMTIIKEKEEYKKDFNDIVREAAAMGRLTRLDEHAVEAIAVEKTPEEEWKSQGLLAIQWRSSHMSVIHEAAAFGNQTKEREHVVSNFPEDDEWEGMYEEEGHGSGRLEELLALNSLVGTGTEKVEKLVLGLREENTAGESMIVRPMETYTKVEEVKLPKPLPPSINIEKYRKRVKEEQEEALRTHRPMTDISSAVAQMSWERRSRLNRPGSMPKVRGSCDCPYCGTASPYQTHAYRVREQRRKHMTKEQRELEDEQMRLHDPVHSSRPHHGNGGMVPSNLGEQTTDSSTLGEQPQKSSPPCQSQAGLKLKEKLQSSKQLSKRNNTLQQNASAKKLPHSTPSRSTTPTSESASANQCCSCVIL